MARVELVKGKDTVSIPADDKVEINQRIARGYKVKAKPAPKSDDGKGSK